MFLSVIILSYLIGCASTIILIIFFYLRYGLYPAEVINEQEQFPTFHPLSENEQTKNSTVDAINYLFQFLFQEFRDTPALRRYIINKIKIELNELKISRIGRLIFQDIIVESCSLGQQCPVFSDIQLEQVERDERNSIKNFVAKLNMDYKDGFSVSLNIKLKFDYDCQLSIKIKHIQGDLRLEFRHEPFTHWLCVFQSEPVIDLEIKSYVSSHESRQLEQIIGQQIRRAIRRKQTWPSYKIRYQPFFSKTKQIVSNNDNSTVGLYDINIKYCDRLAIPFEIFTSEQHSLLSVFVTCDMNEKICEDCLQMDRNQWKRLTIEFRADVHHIIVKEVFYLNQKEFLIDFLQPIPNEIDDKIEFQMALQDKNVFILEINGIQVNNIKEINNFLRSTFKQNDKKCVQVLIGIPKLNCIQIEHVAQQANNNEKIDTQLSSTIRHRLVKDENNQIKNLTDSRKVSLQPQENSSVNHTTIMTINSDILQELHTYTSYTQKAQSFVEFDYNFKVKFNSNERYLNIYLWCKPVIDCKLTRLNKSVILLGYTSLELSEIVHNIQGNFNKECQMALNFRLVDLGNTNSILQELRRHKGYDENLTHGFLTINIKYIPEKEDKTNQTSFSRQTDDQLTVLVKDDETPSTISLQHKFEDQMLNSETCALCNGKIWTKNCRQCRSCLKVVHKKCEKQYNASYICTGDTNQSKSTIADNENMSLSINDSISIKNDNRIETSGTKTSSLFNLTKNDAIRGLRSKHDKFESNSVTNPEQRTISNVSNVTASRFASVASSAYNKLLEFKTKRISPTFDAKKQLITTNSIINENISEIDLQEILSKCLSDENFDLKGLDDLLHEKAVDHTKIYARAKLMGPELFRDLTQEERRQKMDNEISRLQEELNLESKIRDELIIEYNDIRTDDNTKSKIEAKIKNIDEKVQALAALTLLYCSGLQDCYYHSENNE